MSCNTGQTTLPHTDLQLQNRVSDLVADIRVESLPEELSERPYSKGGGGPVC